MNGWLNELRPQLMWVSRYVPFAAWVAIVARAVFLIAIAWPLSSAATGVVLWLVGQDLGLPWWLPVVAFGLQLGREFAPKSWERPLTGLLVVGVVWHGWLFVSHPAARFAGLWLVLVFVVEAWGGQQFVWWSRWRKAMAVRRRWPIKFAIVDHATEDVQASFGGGISSFLSSGSKLLTRPILRHPPLGLWPSFDGPSVTWPVGPPPGTTLASLERIAGPLAGQYSGRPNVKSLEIAVPLDEPGASVGDATFWFGEAPDVLAEVATERFGAGDQPTDGVVEAVPAGDGGIGGEREVAW